MLNNFIYAEQKALFIAQLEAGNILDEAIVFIEDTKEIWNHGTYFDGSKVDLSNIEASIQNIVDNYATKTEIPTKVSQLENDANYIQDDVVSDGVYAVDANGKLIDYNTADSTATGVALVAGEHKFMIAKADATDGTNTTLYWGKNLSGKDVAGVVTNSKSDGTNGSGHLPKSDGSYRSTPNLSGDFTTWTAGALAEFNGAANTAAIIAGYTEHAVSMDARDMCSVLNTFNTSDSHNDWYVPALGQLALMYLNMTEINAALAKIGGTALAAGNYWSSSENSSDYAWNVRFSLEYVGNYSKDNSYRVRFIRDISTTLKERVSDLESNISNKADKTEIPTKASILDNAALTGTPTAPTAATGTNTTQVATTAFVQSEVSSKIAAADAMRFKGTLGTGGTITALPASHKVGDTYKVSSAGTYAGVICEVGDMVICTATGTSANNADWVVIQANIEGLLIGPNSSTDANVAIFSGTTGKVIKDSGFTIGASVPANAKFTDTTYSDATTSTAGLMSATDKTNLDRLISKTLVEGNGTVTNVVSLTQAQYDALSTKNATTLYIVTD